ncbi:MAG: PilZ domain-containing protein [Propionivibrio sp.]|nr:PilZ domain-containing protein [Propionivibrio sp.]
MTDERRHHARIAFHAPARLVLGERTLDVVVLDLSLKGALIRLPASPPLSAGASGMLHVRLNESEPSEQISMQIRVAHVQGPQAGLLCICIDIDSVTHLRRLLELNLGDPALLERELSALIAE